MAVTTTPLSNPIGSAIVTDTDADETGENNVRGAGSTIYQVDIDNSGNGAASYLKIYNNASPVVGTTAPDIVIMAPASGRRVWTDTTGTALGTALSFACVTTGGTAGTTGPTSAVTVRILCT